MKLTPEQDLVRELRIQLVNRDMHQRDLAALIGCSNQTITRFFQEPNNVRLSTVQAVVQALDPDPAIVLRWLKFSERRIRSINK